MNDRAARPNLGDLSRRRLPAIDALRGIAATLVVFPHSFGFFAVLSEDSFLRQTGAKLDQLGLRGVDVFFVLSGFVIAMSTRLNPLTFATVPRFLARRLTRLAPPYWAAMALMIACLQLRSRLSDSTPLPSAVSIVTHLFYLQAFFGHPHIIIVFWTLCYEVQFYLAFASGAAILYTVRSRLGKFADISARVLFLSSIAWSLRRHTGIEDVSARFAFAYWYEFALGILAWHAVDGKSIAVRIVGAAVAAAVLSLGLAYDLPAETASGGVTLLLIVAGFDRLATHTNDRIVLQYLGRISYSLYLVQVPVIYLWLAVSTRLGEPTELKSILLFFATFASVVAAAHLLHVFVELPAIRWSRCFSLRAEIDASR